MTIQTVNFGSASDGSQGDTARAAFGKLNANFTDNANAASRLVGTASGNLLEVGALGVGGQALNYSAIDLNTAPVGSTVLFEGTQANATTYNFPTVTATTTSLVAFEVETFGQGGGASRTVQFATEVFGTSGTRGRTFFRVKHDTNWFAWREVIFSGDSPTFGTVKATGEVQNIRSSAFRQVNGNFGSFFFQDGASLYLMLTANGDQYGSYNALRPFYVNLSSGLVTLGNGIAVNGPSTFSAPLRPAQYTLASMPSASAYTGYEIDVTDASGGAKRCRSDGTNWKILNTTTTVS